MPIGVINFTVIGVRNYFDDGGLNNNHCLFVIISWETMGEIEMMANSV